LAGIAWCGNGSSACRKTTQRRSLHDFDCQRIDSKAATLRDAGHPIEVVAEADFLERLAATEGLVMDLADVA
jgi:hypothetical protein